MPQAIRPIDTSRVHAAERVGYWSNALRSLCGDLKADPFGNKTIDGHIDHGSIGRLQLCSIEVSRHRVALPIEWTLVAPHDVVKIVFQTQGTSVFEQDRNQISLSPGDCFAYDVSRPHMITSPALTKHEVVIIPKMLLEERGISSDRLNARWISARTGAARLAHDFMISTMKEIGTLSPASELGISEALLNILLLPFPVLVSTNNDITSLGSLKKRAKIYIDSRLDDPDLDVDRISAALECSKRYLHMAFKHEDISISEYMWQARLVKCRLELENSTRGEKSITDIAFSWGFSSSSHFSRSFKQKYGMSPSRLSKIR